MMPTDRQKPVLLGVAGMGGFAGSIANLVLKHGPSADPPLKLAAVCDPDPSGHDGRDEELRARGIAVHETYEALLAEPAVEAGEALGFLPGDLQEKIFPYLRPLYDAIYEMCDRQEVERWIENRVIEVAPLAYMRGRTLNRAFVILDEAQNTTCEQMFMFLTRMGLQSRCVVTGDPNQIDLKRSVRSGLHEAMDALRDIEGVQFCHLTGQDVVRHPVVQRIIDAYDRHRDHRARPEARNGGPE